MLWIVLLIYFGKNSGVQGDCNSNTHWMSRIKSKDTGTFACRDCYCEDPLGWICVKKQGECKPDLGRAEHFCKAANSIYLTPIDDGDNQKGCLICKCEGKGKAWSCKESAQACKTLKKNDKDVQLLKATAWQQASSSVETTTGDKSSEEATAAVTGTGSPHWFARTDRRFKRKMYSVEI